MDPIHRVIAYGTAIVTAVGIVWSVLLAVSGRADDPRFERFQALIVSSFIVGAASGLLLLASGARPAEGLHLVYAALAITLIPLARSFTRRASGRPAGALLVVAFVVLGAVVFRLFTTG